MSLLQRQITASTLWFSRFAKPFTCVFFLIVALAAITLKDLTFNASSESFLAKNHPQRLAYLDFERQFGMSAQFIVFIQDDDLFTPQQIERIRLIEQGIIDSVPHVESTSSIVTSTSISSSGDDILIDDFFPVSLDAVDFNQKKIASTANPYFLNRIINQQGDATAIVVKLKRYAQKAPEETPRRLSMPDITETLIQLKKVVAGHDDFSSPVLIGGSPAITVELTNSTRKDMLLFSFMAILIISSSLYYMFRTIAAVVFPLVALLSTNIIVFSIMTIGGYSIQVTGAILPSFLLAVCVGDSVHFLKPFYHAFNAGKTKHQAIEYAINHSGIAMFYTTLTTSLALLSFSFSDISPVSSFGLFSAFGVWLAFFFTISCIPSLIMLTSMKAANIPERFQSIFRFKAYIIFISQHYRIILVLSLFLLLASGFSAAQLNFSYNPISWFHENNPVRMATTTIEDKLSGTMQIELLVSHKSDDGQPLTVTELQLLDDWLTSLQDARFAEVHISSQISILNLLKDANKILNPEAGYNLPDSQELLSQEFLILQLNDNELVESLTDGQLSLIRISMTVPWQDSLIYNRFIGELSKDFAGSVGDKLRLEVTGMATVGNRAFGDMIQSMAYSYLYATLTVVFIMFLLFKSIKLGVLLVLPNVLPIVMTLALMSIFKIQLDLFTMLIGSIAIGIVVDDTIHLVSSFRHYYYQGSDVIFALSKSLETTGIALAITTVVLCLGFLTYSLSDLNNLVAFGYLTALTLFNALIAEFVIAPAILCMLYKK